MSRVQNASINSEESLLSPDMGNAELEAATAPTTVHIEPLSRKLKLLTAVAIFYGNIVFGLAFNTYGPVATTMQNKYETDDATISRVFTILTGCYLVGALSGGFIFNYVNRQLAAIALLCTMAAMMLVTPHLPNMTLFFVSAGIMGVTCGSYDTAQFVWMMEMMQKDCPPYVQSQHFFYALGTSIASLLMAPFLDEEEDDVTTSASIITRSYNEDDISVNGSRMFINADKNDGSDRDKLFVPYTIAGGLIVIAIVYQILLFVFLRYHAPPPETPEGVQGEEASDALKSSDSPVKREDQLAKNPFGNWSWPKLRLVVLSCCFYGAYQGMEMCTFQFFPKFGQNSDLKLTESKSTYVLTGMQVAFALGRGAGIILVFKMSLQLILLVNIILTLVANILLIGWANSSLNVLWASSIIFGFGFSSQYASFSAFIERYLDFTNFMVGLMIVCGSGVAAIYPLIIGPFIEDTPVVLSYTSFFSIGLLIFTLSSVSYITHKDKTRY